MPKIVDHAARRTEIVHALWEVIYSGGIDSVSFRSVAAAAGISIGRVQHYFASRRDLILEGCRQMAEGAEVDESSVGVPRELLREFLRAFIPEGIAMRLGASAWYTYVSRAAADSEIAEIVRATDRATHGLAVQRVGEVMVGAPAEVVDARAARAVAMAKGLAQEVMLEERSAASAQELIDEEVALIAEVAHRDPV